MTEYLGEDSAAYDSCFEACTVASTELLKLLARDVTSVTHRWLSNGMLNRGYEYGMRLMDFVLRESSTKKPMIATKVPVRFEDLGDLTGNITLVGRPDEASFVVHVEGTAWGMFKDRPNFIRLYAWKGLSNSNQGKWRFKWSSGARTPQIDKFCRLHSFGSWPGVTVIPLPQTWPVPAKVMSTRGITLMDRTDTRTFLNWFGEHMP